MPSMAIHKKRVPGLKVLKISWKDKWVKKLKYNVQKNVTEACMNAVRTQRV